MKPDNLPSKIPGFGKTPTKCCEDFGNDRNLYFNMKVINYTDDQINEMIKNLDYKNRWTIFPIDYETDEMCEGLLNFDS